MSAALTDGQEKAAGRVLTPKAAQNVSQCDFTIVPIASTKLEDMIFPLAAYPSFYETRPSEQLDATFDEVERFVLNNGKPYLTENKNYGPYFTGPMKSAPLVCKTRDKAIAAGKTGDDLIGVMRSASHSLGGMVFKHDLDDVPEEEFAKSIRAIDASGVAFIAFSTFKHGTKTGLVRARVLTFANRLATPEEFRVVSEAIGLLLLGRTYDDSEHHSYQLAGIWMCPKDRADRAVKIVRKGGLIDIDAILAQTPKEKPKRAIAGDSGRHSSQQANFSGTASKPHYDAEAFPGMDDPPEYIRRRVDNELARIINAALGTDDGLDDVEWDDLRSALWAISPDDQGVWSEIAFALYPLGEEGLELFLEWSEKCDKAGKWNYDAAITKWNDKASTWKTEDGIGRYREIFKKARKAGWTSPQPPLEGKVIGASEDPEVVAAINRLAGLGKVDYELTRKAESKKLGLRITALDELVEEARAERAKASRERAKAEGGEDEMRWVEEFNDKFSPVLYGGKMRVGFTEYDGTLNRETMAFVNWQTFREMHSSDYGVVGYADDGSPIRQSKGAWLSMESRTPNRRLIFDPAMPPKLEREGYLNLWGGFAVSGSSEGGTVEPMLRHIREVICDNDVERTQYVLGWVALLIQQPGCNHGVALVLRGKKGAGKGIFAQPLMRIMGRHAVHLLQPRHLTGNFNAHLQDVCFVFADEAFFAGDRSNDGALKGLITETLLQIEPKGVDAYQVRNWMTVLMATNSEWVAPMGADERRYAVMDVSEARLKDHDYFNELGTWASNDANLMAFIEWAQAYDLSEFNVRQVPETEALKDQRAHSLPTWAKWWGEVLSRGSLASSSDGEWYQEVGSQVFPRSYGLYVDANRLSSYERLTDNTLGKHLTSLFDGAISTTLNATKDARDVPEGIGGDWNESWLRIVTLGKGDSEKSAIKGRKLGTLEEERKRFIDHFKLPASYFGGL